MDAVHPVNLKSISKTLFRFILSIIILMALGIVLTSSVLIRNTLDEIYTRFVRQEANYLENGLNEFLETKLSTVIDHAGLPIMVNSVMHPEHDHSFLKDFLGDLRLQEHEVEYTLLDINGGVIQSNAKNLRKDWKQINWFTDIVDGKDGRYIEMFKQKDKVSILIAVPVKYNDYPEGVLVGVIPSSLGVQFSALLQERSVFATISSNGSPVHDFGVKRETSAIKKQIALPIINGRLELEAYKSEINAVLINLFESVLVVVLIFSALFIFVFKKIGIKLVIQPQELLEKSRLETAAVNEKLSVANEELAQFAYRASHDLKAPLLTTRGLAGFICHDVEAGAYDEVKFNANKIAQHVTRLETLVNDILDLAKADLEISSHERIDLTELIEEIKIRLEKSYVDSEVKVDVDVPSDLNLFASKTRISQVLENLVSNAIKYSDPDKDQRFVEVSARKLEGKTEIKVRDNGLGIPEEFSPQVFKMFQRFHPDVSNGSGLGMYIVKKHIDNMNASLNYSSSPAGTEFNIEIS